MNSSDVTTCFTLSFTNNVLHFKKGTISKSIVNKSSTMMDITRDPLLQTNSRKFVIKCCVEVVHYNIRHARMIARIPPKV